MKNLKEYRDNATGFADLLHYASLVADGIVLSKDGSLLAGWYYRGLDMESSSPAELEAMTARLNSILSRFGNGWMLQVDSIRHSLAGYAKQGYFPDRTTATIDSERREQYLKEGNHFSTKYAIILTYVPPLKSDGFLAGISGESSKGRGSYITLFEEQCNDFERSLTSIFGKHIERMRRIRVSDSVPYYQDRLLSYLHYCVTGITQPIALPTIPMFLDNLIGGDDFIAGMEPQIGERHIRAITIDGFPAESYPGILNMLHSIPIDYRWNTRFIFMDAERAQSLINRIRKKWKQKAKGLKDQLMDTATGPINHDALEMAADAEGALSDSSSGLVRFGHYTSVIILMDKDRETIEESCNHIAKNIRDLGFAARIETVNAIEAYLGSLPGHGYYNIRKSLLHTLNLADLLPITAIWQGHNHNPCPFYPKDSPPLLYAATTGTTPFYLSLHSGDVGHTLILGPTGAGKSVLLATIMAQHLRYKDAQVFCFDKGYSAYTLCMAAGGDHYEPAAENSSLHFAPLAMIHNDAERAWAAEWIELLLSLQKIDITSVHRNAIHDALLLLMQSSSRTLTDFQSKLQDKTLRDALRPYTLQGMGRLLDERKDGLKDGKLQVFEMQELMERGGHYIQPVLSYLFHRIEQRLDGSPTLIVLDEAWICLENKLFQNKIREWLKVLRKANAAVVFATQSITDISNSPICDVIYESCVTKILLPNPEANLGSAKVQYEKLGLNEHQIHMIATAEKKRHYYYLSPEGKRFFELGLGQVALSFLAASGKEELRNVRELIGEYGELWPSKLLEQRGLHDWAEYWRNV
jgi:type IV secretion system protein TrbE